MLVAVVVEIDAAAADDVVDHVGLGLDRGQLARQAAIDVADQAVPRQDQHGDRGDHVAGTHDGRRQRRDAQREVPKAALQGEAHRSASR